MEFPPELKYSKEHEWVRDEDEGTVVIGISDFAQDELGDVVYLELPEEGAVVTRGETFGVVESVKAVSDLFSPVTGTVAEVNKALIDAPETINDDTYNEAWMIKVELSNPDEMGDLLSAEAYEQYTQEEK